MKKHNIKLFVILILFTFVFQSFSFQINAKSTEKKPVTIKSIGDIELIIHPLEKYILPQNVTAIMTNKTSKKFAVTWEKKQIARGAFTIETILGTVKGYSKKVKCDIVMSDYVTPKKTFREAKPGDIVGIGEKTQGVYFEHYGVFIGDNKVIHYSSPNGTYENAIFTTDSMSKAFPKGKYFVLDFTGMEVYSAEKTIERAKKIEGEKKYDIINNNCEHAAVWCKTGLRLSYQIYALSPPELEVLKLLVNIGLNVGTQKKK